MALFFNKKKRATRSAIVRPATSLPARLSAAVRDRGLMLRLTLCLFAVLTMVLAVEGWKASFPYRLGDAVDSGITARVGFERVNTFETNRAISDRSEKAPYIFSNDTAPLEQLPAKLRVSLSDIAQAVDLEELKPEIRAAFGLTVAEAADSGAGAKPGVTSHDFATLKAAVSGEDNTAGNRIDDLVSEFERLIAPLHATGLVDGNDFVVHAIPDTASIAIMPMSEDSAPRTVPRADLVMADLLKDTGTLGKSWHNYVELAVIRTMLERWLLAQSPVTLKYDGQRTQQARTEAISQVEPVTIEYNKGDLLLSPGEPIDHETLSVLLAEYNQVEKSVGLNQRITRVATVFLLVLVLAVMIGHYIVNAERKLVRHLGRLVTYLTAIVVTVLLCRLLSFDPWRAEVVPLLATVMVLAIAYNQVFAGLTAIGLTLVVILSTSRDLGQFVVLVSVAAAVVIPLSNIPSRSTLIKVGFASAIVHFFVSLGIGIVQGQSISDPLTDSSLLLASLRGAGWCLVAGYLVAGSLPFIESMFGVVTDISLLEMSDISHPLLQELVRRAPGTYNHSITVAALAETAADRIGANGLLVRVGAYFHDVGKMLKPQYFVENMTEGSESRHEHLAPAMSTLIIIGHVKDGVDLAQQHNLPRPLIDFVEQHHGTTLVEYFYHEAAKQVDQQPDHKTDAEESSFRYPGPKPQSREAGVLMIADAVESASRTLSEPTPKRIERLVHEITLKRLLDGQFDECSLTLSEIRSVEESLIKSLIAIYHGRIKYPEQRTA